MITYDLSVLLQDTRHQARSTVRGDEAAERPGDRVQRQFSATRPNQLWVADITFVATWAGFVYVAFVVDVFARRIVGWLAGEAFTEDGAGAGCAGAGAVVTNRDRGAGASQ